MLFAEKDGRNIAAIMCFKFKGRVSVEYSVVDERYMQFNPNHLLFWFAIKKAKYEGYNVFDFGRTHVENKGLNDFKRRWGTKEIELIDIFFPETMKSRLSDHGGLGRKVVTGLCKRAPVKVLCNLSNFCYRHLG